MQALKPESLELNTRVKLAIEKHWREHYSDPTYRDIVRETGIAVSVVHYTVKNLRKYSYFIPETKKLIPIWVKTLIDEV